MPEGLLSGRTVVVTGGASGIGLVVARRCARQGARLALLDVAGDVPAAAQALTDETGAPAIGVRTDVTDPASLQQSADDVVEAFGGVDVVVVNAGILHLAPVLDIDPAAWRRVLEVNLTGAFLTSQVYGRRLVEQGRGGRIVLSSSLFGVRGGPENGAYSASKFGMLGLMQCLAAELAPHGITVNAVCPGQVRTPMMEQLFVDRAALTGSTPEAVEAGMLTRIPVGRLADPDEVADVYVYLASELSRYVTGQALVVDGGYQLS
jgi:NAD(P)-dependent dehydrogenase (short-subunit alcohol dehydrogenase family)